MSVPSRAQRKNTNGRDTSQISGFSNISNRCRCISLCNAPFARSTCSGGQHTHTRNYRFIFLKNFRNEITKKKRITRLLAKYITTTRELFSFFTRQSENEYVSFRCNGNVNTCFVFTYSYGRLDERTEKNQNPNSTD